MKVFTVRDPVFKTEPLFVLGCTHAKLNTYLKRYRVTAGTDDAGQHVGQMLTFEQPPWRVVWSERLDAGIVLHEVFHLVTRICQDRGIAIRAVNGDGELGDETAAYLFEFFARAVLRRVKP